MRNADQEIVGWTGFAVVGGRVTAGFLVVDVARLPPPLLQAAIGATRSKHTIDNSVRRATRRILAHGPLPASCVTNRGAVVFDARVEDAHHDGQRRRTRRSLRIVSGLVTVAAVVIAVVLIARSSGPGSGTSRVVGSDAATTTTLVGATAAATAGQLASGHWATIPMGPLGSRPGAGAVWTGKEVVVWGGMPTPWKLEHDAAAYNPSTRTWRMLPAWPLTPVSGATGVWTGSEIVFWGGVVPTSGHEPDHSKITVAYRPDSDTWVRLADAPLREAAFPIGFWTGDRMVVFGSYDAASYDPATDAWHVIPPPQYPANPRGWEEDREGWHVAVAAGPGRILAWSGWNAWPPDGSSETPTAESSDLFRLDVSSDRWTLLDPGPDVITGPSAAYWTGTRLLVTGRPATPASVEGPPPIEMRAWYDPDTGKAARIGTETRDWTVTSAYTGAALWSVDSSGNARAFDPATDESQVLHRAPIDAATYEAPRPVWTGTSVVLFFGSTIPPATPSDLGGLEYIVDR